ncbi:MAG: hypothetical protein IAE91_04690 [Ignavibacteriaceae bacterium]|nr:hypothetical protein [Ignavibacteriaceae bacterium]
MTKIASILILSVLFFGGCKKGETNHGNTGIVKYTILNLTVMLDLSDRISPKVDGTQVQKDMGLIKQIVESFKDQIMRRNNLPATKDILRIVVYPQGNYIITNNLDKDLVVDFSSLSLNEKRELLHNFESSMIAAIEKIYEHASNAKNFNGSDIFNFIKHQAVNYCVKPNYKNVLTIFSDGYMYFQNAQYNTGNRYSYMLESSPFMSGLRNSKDLKKDISAGNYGFVSTGVSLKGLEVICLEFQPGKTNPIDFDIMKIFWSDWFKDMKIEEDKIHIYRSDLVSNTVATLKSHIKAN